MSGESSRKLGGEMSINFKAVLLFFGVIISLTTTNTFASTALEAARAAAQAGVQAAQSATGGSSIEQCNWPMRATLKQVQSREYPASVNILFTGIAGDSDLINITETTTVGLGIFKAQFPALVQNSAEWQQMQTKLSCQNRAGDFSFEVQVSNGRLIATIGNEIEKFACSGMDVPCPTWDKPLRVCRRDANTKVWGARILTRNEIGLVPDANGSFKAEVLSTNSSSNTSEAQNFIRDIIGGAFTFAGVNIVRSLEASKLNDIKSEIRKSFSGQGFVLGNNAKVPSFPNYQPKITEMRFVEIPGIGQPFEISAVIRREVSEFRSNTGCAMAKQLGAVRMSNR